jgi:hypothetical protein
MNKMKYRPCKKCGNEFPNWAVVDGKKWNLRSRQFCLTCSPIGTHNTRDLTEGDYGTKLIDGVKYKRCRECENVKPFTDFYSKSEWGRRYSVCGLCNRTQSKERRDSCKKWCVEYKGGKCKICGYDKCMRSLDFHHLDSSQKDYGISSSWKKTKEELMKELDKCVLVCRNCHGEIHEGIIKL